MNFTACLFFYLVIVFYPFSALPAGVYVLKVRDEEGGNMHRRIEVQR